MHVIRPFALIFAIAALMSGCASTRRGQPSPSASSLSTPSHREQPPAAASNEIPARDAAQPPAATLLAEPQTAPQAVTTPADEAAADDSDADSPLTFLDNFHAIVDGRIYRSAQVRPETIAYARRQYGVQTVINLRGTNERDEWYQQERDACAAEGIQLIDVRLSSTELPLPEELLKLYDALTAAPEPVLLHCKAGADRTGLAAAMWRRLALREDAEQAGLQLSVLYGHFRGANPAMIDFIRMFVPSREWIISEYPRLREEYISRQQPPAAAEET
ncbi:MAG: hypothetical protein CHACPFDD_00171 [Phycisphaerae bacterium]|nr:hypothetical protein [Phycisphaerae bacterium]